MTATVAIVVDGVLKNNNSDSVLAGGALLYHGLAEVMKIALITDEDKERTQRWLAINGFREHVLLLSPDADDVLVGGTRRAHQIVLLKLAGSDVDMLVEPDPTIAAAVLQAGTPVMLFAHPKYSRPEFRPGGKNLPTPWSTLVAEIEAQETLRAGDTRIGADA